MEPGESSLLFRGIPLELRLTPKDKRALARFADTLSDRVAEGRTFTCLLTNDEELCRLNRLFLKHDYPTDVLSFPSEGTEAGEIAISVQRADTQAGEFGHSRLQEIQLLMLHGVLHLTGLDHEKDSGEMARAERRWQTEFELPTALVARSKAPRPVSKGSRR
jgi:probable rRNA maturation factor